MVLTFPLKMVHTYIRGGRMLLASSDRVTAVNDKGEITVNSRDEMLDAEAFGFRVVERRR